MILNFACYVCYGMHNEFGELRPIGEVLKLPSWIYECHIWAVSHHLYMYMVAFLALRILYVVALVCFVFVPWFFPLLNPSLAKMSSAGYCHARFLLSAFFYFLFFSDRVRPQFVLV